MLKTIYFNYVINKIFTFLKIPYNKFPFFRFLEIPPFLDEQILNFNQIPPLAENIIFKFMLENNKYIYD